MSKYYYDLITNLTEIGKDKDGKPLGENEYGEPTEFAKNSYKPNESFKDIIKEGDFICFNESGEEEERYRNEGVYSWDGKNLTDLDYSIDDYGSLSKKFPAGKKYSITHFTQIYENKRYFMVAHNSIIHLDKGLYKKIKIKHDKKTNEFKGEVLIHNENVTVIFNNNSDNINSVKKLREFLATYPHMNFIEGKEVGEPIEIECVLE